MNITETYERTAEKWPEKCAVQDRGGSITYGEWAECVARTARWLLKRGQRRYPHRVGLYLRNHHFFLQCFAAAARAGWTAVPFDPRWGSEELEEKIRLSGVQLIVAEPDWADRRAFDAIRVATADRVRSEINRIGTEEARTAIDETALTTGATRMPDDRVTAIPADGEVSATDNLPFFFGFTSGSTGRPKGFVRNQNSWVSSFACNVRDLTWSAQDRILVAGSLFNTHFLYAAVCGLYLGATVILLHSFSPKRCLQAMRAGAPTQVIVVPTMLESLLSAAPRFTAVLSHKLPTMSASVSWDKPFHWVSSGAKCSASTKRQVRAAFPAGRFDEFYGASELSFVSLCRQEENAPDDSVGRPFSSVSIKVRRKDGTWADPGEEGEIFVKSPLICSHYLSEKGAVSLPHTGEWVTVGDIGYLDNRGYLFIRGRKNGMVNYGGLNLFPEEIERVLQRMAEIEQVAVVGLPDRHWGQIPAAFIQTRSRQTLDKKRLRTYCQNALTAYKIPQVWYVVRQMPLTAGGKIDKRRLMRRIGEAGQWKRL